MTVTPSKIRLALHRPAASRLLSTGLLAALGAFTAVDAGAQLRDDSFSPMTARSIGPAGMSGRVSVVAVDHADPSVIFVGAATGGVWRSRDGGISFEPVFDDQPVLGVGAVAIAARNPDVVWVGTGEGNPRNSAGVGNGVYRSLDGGDTWEHMGLEESERIHRVLIHPADPDVVYVGAMGPAWSDGEERGVFRTRDGGESWERVLFVDETTGIGDLVMDPRNPDKLFAAMWSFRRWPWFFDSGGPGSGLHVTHDGGDTWTRLGEPEGLPPGELGRIGVAISDSDPNVVYALVEATKSELLRSNDGGRSWATINDDDGVANRPFYYADLRVDPSNENRLYTLHSAVQVSEDSGRSFETVVPSQIIHGDVHELWIDPRDSRHMILGEDGGIAITWDRGDNWRFVENLPLAQFYHINVDMETPFNLYGGLQDNGSWFGPSTAWQQRGIFNLHWTRVGGGDGFATLPDFQDPRYGYSMSQQGNLMRFDKATGSRRSIRPVHPDGEPLRFNWNAALNVDPIDSTSIYLGSQFVHRSRDGGLTWQIISPDLTTNDPAKQRQMESGGLTLEATGAENHTTILSIAPSPLESGTIWVTTDDGNVQLTRDDGANWTNLIGDFDDLPDSTYAPHVEPSKHDTAVAYVVFDDHRRGNWTPYAYRTDDYGESWDRIADDDLWGYVHVIEEDPVEPNLLFLGTEFGMYVSLDRGESWMEWRNGLPPAPIRGIMVHPRDHDLAIGTHGRAAYVIDDIRPLRALAADPTIAEAPLHAFELAPAIQYEEAEAQGYRSTGHAMFQGDLRPYGALIHYWLGEAGADVDITVSDGSGNVVRSLDGTSRRGLNRVAWNLRSELDPGDDGGFFRPQGPWVLPGVYTVRVEAGDSVAETTVQVLADPRVDVPTDLRRAKIAAQVEAASWTTKASEARRRVTRAREAVDQVLSTLDDDALGARLREQAEAVRAEIAREEERLFTGPECQGICGGDPVDSRVRAPQGRLGSSVDAPSATDVIVMDQARAALGEVVDSVNRLLADHVTPLRQALIDAGYTPFAVLEPVSMP